MQVPVIKLSRKQLYDEIWEISVSGVAKKYGIPYPQMLNQVKHAGIPFPPSGYWTKLKHGKPVEVIPLSEPHDADVQLYKEFSVISNPTIQERETDTKTSSISQKDTADALKSSKISLEEPETTTRYGQTLNIYDRQTLYKEVWKSPVTEVAKKYKVSDVAIQKICKSLEIPTPERGYWAKVRAGQKLPKPPLPRSQKPEKKEGVQTGPPVKPIFTEGVLPFLEEENRTMVLAIAAQILLPGENDKMHSVIIAHRKKITEWRKEQKSREKQLYWNRRNREDPPYLAVTISENALPRVCRIIDALIKATEPLGCKLNEDLLFRVNGEEVRLSFSESQEKLNHIPTKEENLKLLEYQEEVKRRSWASKPQIPKYDYVFNGKLSVTVNKKSFRDCKSYVLEDRLGDIMLEMYNEAEILKQERIAKEEAERKRQEEARKKEELHKRYNKEIDYTLALVNKAEDYATACKIRAYIAAVEASAPEDANSKWIAWAKAKADWYDPTIASKDPFFGTREHGKDPERKKLSYNGYWW